MALADNSGDASVLGPPWTDASPQARRGRIEGGGRRPTCENPRSLEIRAAADGGAPEVWGFWQENHKQPRVTGPLGTGQQERTGGSTSADRKVLAGGRDRQSQLPRGARLASLSPAPPPARLFPLPKRPQRPAIGADRICLRTMGQQGRGRWRAVEAILGPSTPVAVRHGY